MGRTFGQVVIMAGVAVGLGYLVLSSADGWADWVVFGAIVMTAYGASLAVNHRLYARRKRAISRESPEVRRSRPLA